MLLTGPFGGLTDDVREFLRCLDGDAQLGFVFAAWWEGVDWGDWAPRPELGRLLWHERDASSRSWPAFPPARSTWPASPTASGSRPAIADPASVADAAADPGEWRQALWSTALAPLAMLGALDLPARMSPSPAWFALAGTAPALLAAAAAMSGPEPPPSLASATAN